MLWVTDLLTSWHNWELPALLIDIISFIDSNKGCAVDIPDIYIDIVWGIWVPNQLTIKQSPALHLKYPLLIYIPSVLKLMIPSSKDLVLNLLGSKMETLSYTASLPIQQLSQTLIFFPLLSFLFQQSLPCAITCLPCTMRQQVCGILPTMNLRSQKKPVSSCTIAWGKNSLTAVADYIGADNYILFYLPFIWVKFFKKNWTASNVVKSSR